MAKIIQEHEKCIGCGSCAIICPKYWQIDDDSNKAKLKGAKLIGSNFELEIEKVECNQDAADACPVQCIHVKS